MADPKAKAPVAEAPVQEPQVDATQQVETDAYVPKYRIKPEFKQALIKAIGKYPFNQTAQIFQAVETEFIDHNQLNQVVNVLGNFPYQDVAPLMTRVTDYVEQVVED
jgi:hypothetical protein